MSEKHENIEDFVRKVVDQSEGQITFNEAHWQQMESLLDVEMPVIPDPGLGYYQFSNVVSLLVGVVFLLSWLVGPLGNVSEELTTDQTQVLERVAEVPVNPPSEKDDAAQSTKQVVIAEDEDLEPSSGSGLKPVRQTLPKEETTPVKAKVADTQVDATVKESQPATKSTIPSEAEEKKASLDVRSSDPNMDKTTQESETATSVFAKRAEYDNGVSLPSDVENAQVRTMISLLSKGVDLGGALPVLPDTLGRVMAQQSDGGMNELRDGPVVKRNLRGGFSRWSVGLSLAPDFSSNEMFKYSRLGRDLGIVVDYWLNSRLAISIGAYNTSKRYLVSGDAYNSPAGFWGNVTNGELPNKIDADCRVIDIPINVKYQLLSKPKFNIAASIGASSYIMLQEDYKYELDNWESEWSTSNENQHFFGVGNLQLHFERRFGKHFAVEAAPFFKVPLTGYGHGNIRFHSMGSLFTIRKYLFAR